MQAEHTHDLTAEQSADLKQALKRDTVTSDLRAKAEQHHAEADEAYFEVERGHDSAAWDSWVAEEQRAHGKRS